MKFDPSEQTNNIYLNVTKSEQLNITKILNLLGSIFASYSPLMTALQRYNQYQLQKIFNEKKINHNEETHNFHFQIKNSVQQIAQTNLIFFLLIFALLFILSYIIAKKMLTLIFLNALVMKFDPVRKPIIFILMLQNQHI